MRKEVKIGIGVATSIVLVVALYVFYSFDPEKQSFFPKCPFLLLTGYECPGCGSQRAIHSLLHLDILAALKYNAFMIVALPYILLGGYFEYFGGKQRFPSLEKVLFGRWAALFLLTFILVYWVVRNM